jgi:hypothetical protein
MMIEHIFSIFIDKVTWSCPSLVLCCEKEHCYSKQNVLRRTSSLRAVALFCTYHRQCSLLPYLPLRPKRVGPRLFAAEQLVVLCYWLVGYAVTFLIGCRFRVCFFTRVDASMAFWRPDGCQLVQCPSECRGEW